MYYEFDDISNTLVKSTVIYTYRQVFRRARNAGTRTLDTGVRER
jgi:hypothetical protein